MFSRGLGFPEIIFILVIVLLIFGPKRIAKVAGEMGKGIKAFKDGITGEDDEQDESSEKEGKE